MKKLIVLALAAVLAAGCGHLAHMMIGGGPQIQGSGKLSSISRHLGNFKSVHLDGAMDADITIGKATDAKIEGDDNLIPLVKTEIKDGALHISLDGNYSTKNPLKVTLAVPELEAATINGSGDLALHGYHGSKLALSINGSGDVKAQGEAQKLSASISGSGALDLYGLRSVDADVQINGSGDARVFSSGMLNTHIVGSGSVTYRGEPKNVGKSIVGSGSVDKG